MNPVSCAEKIPGWMVKEELEWLYDKAKQMQSIAEFGCYKGRSTTVLCAGCPGEVYSVDRFTPDFFIPDGGFDKGLREDGRKPSPYKDFIKNTREFSNLWVLPMSSIEAATSPLIPSMLDMIFLDTNHNVELVLEELKLWTSRARILLCGHDYEDPNFTEPPHPGVKQALSEFFGLEKIANGPHSIWYLKG